MHTISLRALVLAVLVTGSLVPGTALTFAREHTKRSPSPRLTYIRGNVFVQHSNHRVRGKPGIRLVPGDRVATSATGRAIVRVDSDTVLRLNTQSQIVLGHGSRFTLMSGDLDAALSAASVWTLHTAGYGVSAPGGEVALHAGSSGATVTDVRGLAAVVKGGQIRYLRPNQILALGEGGRPELADGVESTHWVDTLPAPRHLSDDISLSESGGHVADVSSQLAATPGGASGAASNALDGDVNTAWISAPGATQWITLGFSDSRTFLISYVRIARGPALGTGAAPGRRLQILVSSSGTASSDFHRIRTVTVAPGTAMQGFKLPARLLARYVKLVFSGGSAQSVTSIAQIDIDGEVQGKPVRKSVFGHPFDIATDASGNVYVVDGARGRVQVLNPAGAPIRAFGEFGTKRGQMRAPTSIVLDAASDAYVADSSNDRVDVFSPTGHALYSWGKKGTQAGEFNEPAGVGLDATGNLYVADSRNERVVKLSAHGAALGVFGGGGDCNPFCDPERLAVAANGNIYVADARGASLFELDPQGKVLAHIGGQGSGPGQFNLPFGVSLDAKGNVYVADSGNNRIQEFSPDLKPVRQIGTRGIGPGQFGAPMRVLVRADGSMLVAEYANERIQLIDASGQGLAFWR